MILAIDAALIDAAGILDAPDLALVFRGFEIRTVALIGICEQRHRQNDQRRQTRQYKFQPAHLSRKPRRRDPKRTMRAADRLSWRP